MATFTLPNDYKPPALPAFTLPATNHAMSHTMLRVRDPIASLKFYIEVLGMTLVKRSDSVGGKFTNYFLLYPQSTIPGATDKAQANVIDSLGETERNEWIWNQQGIVELCHNWGTEIDSGFGGYKTGNEPEHRGFGHLCILVDNLQEAVKRFDSLGVRYKKRPEDGTMRHIAFILDPDGYWVEVIARGGKTA